VVSEPADIANVPEEFETDPDDQLDQAEVMREINAGTPYDEANVDAFNAMKPKTLKLSTLKRFFDEENDAAVNTLNRCHKILVDEDFKVKFGAGELKMDTNKTMLDYHLTVANSIGLGSLIPTSSSTRYSFQLDLKKPYRDFKGKHAMTGFDTKGRMLYIGQCANEDVFMAMAPDELLSGHSKMCAAGHSTGRSTMTSRQYRQLVMMFAHFLAKIPTMGFFNISSVYKMDLEGAEPNWDEITNIMCVPGDFRPYVTADTHLGRYDDVIRLNVENVKELSNEIIKGYDNWVKNAPQSWKADGFLERNSPIVITSRFGQNTPIAVLGNEEREADSWDTDRDYTKIAFMTIALATSIE
jgi:hypothetical protein